MSSRSVFARRCSRVAEHLDLTDTGLGGGAVVATLTTTYDHDANGNVVRVVDPSGNVSTRAYDALDRRTVTGFADATAEQIAYDSAGNVVRRRGGNGVVTSFRYDPLNRRLRTDVDASAAAGLVLEGETFASTGYDGAGRPVREANDFVIITRDFSSATVSTKVRSGYSATSQYPRHVLLCRLLFFIGALKDAGAARVTALLRCGLFLTFSGVMPKPLAAYKVFCCDGPYISSCPRTSELANRASLLLRIIGKGDKERRVPLPQPHTRIRGSV